MHCPVYLYQQGLLLRRARHRSRGAGAAHVWRPVGRAAGAHIRFCGGARGGRDQPSQPRAPAGRLATGRVQGHSTGEGRGAPACAAQRHATDAGKVSSDAPLHPAF